MRRRITTLVVLTLLTLGTVVGAGSGPAVAGHPLPDSIPLPDGFQPEGLTIGRGTSFYVGSLAGGAVFRGDLVTGRGSILVPGTPGAMKTGLKVDRHNRLWAATASGGGAAVHDARTGALLATYRFTDDPDTFVNDEIVTRDAVYFTDSVRPFLYVVPLGRDGRLPGQSAVRSLALSGPAADADAFNNGIVATADGRLVVVQMVAGRLVSIDPRTGTSRLVDLHGYSVVDGDGLVLRDHLLYVVRNLSNLVAVLRLDPGSGSGRLVREITSPLLRVPATGDLFGPWLYVVNARFDVTPTPTTDYDVVRLRA
jgi:sugar lactone lactonase YvrE